MSSSISDSSTRNRSDSTEDSELPEHEHKRPRLSDTKPDATHVMSDLQQLSSAITPSVPVVDTNAALGHNHLLTPPLPPRSSVSSTVVSPTSKVTINTRPLSSQSVTQPAAGVDEPDMSTSHSSPAREDSHESPNGPEISQNVNPAPPINAEPADIPETISISSSPSKSPEIEIAEIEDYDQDPAQTKWTSRVGGASSIPTLRPIQAGHVYRTFPYAHETSPGNTSRIVVRIKEKFQYASTQDGELFTRVKEWMTDFVAVCREFPARLIEEDRDFWVTLPELITGLAKRDAAPPAQARTEDLADFFVAYAHIVKLLMDYDARNLKVLSETVDPSRLRSSLLMSPNYVWPLAWILQFRVPFYEALRTTHNFDIAQFHTHVIDRIVDPTKIAIMSSMTKLLTEAAGHLGKRQDAFTCFFGILNLTQHLMCPITNTINQVLDAQYPPLAHIDHLRDSCAEIILKADNVLQREIIKQSPWLNLETCGKILDQLNPIMAAIAIEVPQIGKDIISTAGVGFADSDLTDLPSTMPWAWKFKTLRKFVTHGRMELRVFGVDCMQGDLVQIFKENIEPNRAIAMTNPLVRFLVKFIKDNHFVDYVIGVDSHPQLIRRSHNVVGFLCVSGTYDESDTDNIWTRIIESQDPRTVHEVFGLLQGCFSVYALPSLYYICQKLLEFPFQRYDQHVVNFTVALFAQIRQNMNYPTLHPPSSTPRQLCIRLLREAAMEENIYLEQATLIRRDFISQLGLLLTLGRPDASLMTIDEDEQAAIISEAVMNIKAHHQYRGGDLQVLNALVPLLTRDSIPDLIFKFDVTAVLVADFIHIRDQFELVRKEQGNTSMFEILYEIRTNTLCQFINWLPETFPPESVEVLWNCFFTAPELPAAIRSRSWEMLVLALRFKPPGDENLFLDLVIDKHLQSLGPQDYCERSLEFIKMSVLYTIRRTPQAAMQTDDIVVIPGIERLWKVMLEAPPNTVENEATDFIIKQYLDHLLITRRSKAVIEATHSSLVDRCVRQVIASASKLKSYTDGTMSGEDEPMVIIASEDEIRGEELRFDRSLLFLRKFLEGLKQRPQYSPIPSQSPGLPGFPDKKGESFELTIQIGGSKYVTDQVHRVTVGSENTGDELFKYLADISGFTKFTLFHYGGKVSIEGSNTSLADIALTKGGLILVSKTANTPENVPTRSARASSPVDNKIMHHFDDLYDLLDTDERLSREVYSFLILFSAQTEVVRLIRSMERSPAELLPPGKPFKLLYCARALRSCIECDSFSSTPDTEFLTYSIRTIVATLPNLELSSSSDTLQMPIVHGLMEALLLAFRAKVPIETSRQYLEDRKEFAIQVSRLLRFTLDCNGTNVDELSTSVMVKIILETFVEACLHDERIWSHVDIEANLQELVLMAFVRDPRSEVRHSLLEVVIGLTGAAGTKLHLKINNPRAPRSRFPAAAIEGCLMHLWAALVEILPRACLLPQNCAETCESMLSIMRRIGKSFSVDSLRLYFDQWTSLLNKHEHVENVGQPLADHVVAGLTKLLFECCKLLKLANALPSSNQLIDDLLNQFLYPPLSDSDYPLDDITTLPILDIGVRENLYNLVLSLCQEPRDTAIIISKLHDDLLPGDFFEPMYSHDKQSLRSDVGYAGLRNLSNTCYLNSLFAQLFMNVQFREIFLNTKSSESSRQPLVSELAKVFAFMQNSYEKSVDPSGAVEAITTYEGEQIDVSVQMDVDEFFNLLFDRLEGQIDEPTRALFKSIYGGQLVQQVKSKECEHISERLEPFSAVQVEIKGKARLEDSLRAYVEGEVLQGENKYSCTSCGRHVDAVKRACLKDVRDNLIFNLKRFDYDIMTGMRAKVNDEFQFPDTLDIAPYTLARLSDDEQSEEPDYFQLVGVIVHSGTADSGHYYSYIRQRPSIKEVQDSWVQFNDQDVNVFDVSQMREQCFGGNAETFYNIPKFYSAYMLFYQRTSSIQKVEQQYRNHDSVNPVRLPLLGEMEQHLCQHNELYLRSYCAQDTSHARFVLFLLERMRQGTDEHCSHAHNIESSMIEMVLEYVRQISSRWKDLPFVEDTIKVILHYIDQCPSCAKTVANWFASSRVIEDVIVRSPYQSVRKNFGNLFMSVFKHMQTNRATVTPGTDNYRQVRREYRYLLEGCLGQLARLWDTATRTARCWAEYFGVLIAIQKLGDEELSIILDEEFVEKCVDLVMVHLNNPAFQITKRLRTRYAAYLNARDKNRQFNHGIFIRFFVNILQRVDFHLLPDGDDRGTAKKLGLTSTELEVLGLTKVPPNLEWLKRLIAGGQNPNAVDALIEHLAADRRLAGSVSEVIIKGLDDGIVSIAAHFLRPTLIFCENCRSENQIFDLVQAALQSISTVGLDHSRNYFDFVQGLLRTENEWIEGEPGFLEDSVLQNMQHWAPTFLLSANDIQLNIRQATVDLLRRMLFEPLQEAETENSELYRIYRTTCQDLSYNCHLFVHRMFFEPSRRDGTTLQPGQVSQIIDVVEHCTQYFNLENPIEEGRLAQINNTMTQLRFKAESAIETLSADWQENSSELAELSAEDYDDLNSP